MLLGALLACVAAFIGGAAMRAVALVPFAVVGGIIVLFLLSGMFIVNPNEAKVLLLFGKYAGSVRQPGMYWANPFYRRTSISLRIHNFESAKLKVNDHDGNPIENRGDRGVARRRFGGGDVRGGRLSRLRPRAERVGRAKPRDAAPYDAHQEGQLSLRGSTAEVAEQLKEEIQERVSKAGVEVSEARISHLAYSPEIAAAMLRRQQASAIIAARQKIVEGAVSMVEMALHQLTERKIVEMDEERKATMVSNLMVVLCTRAQCAAVLYMGRGEVSDPTERGATRSPRKAIPRAS
jgi:regulator of protease activity HflC (stomatin/prohibitin superfamily)